MSIGTIHGQNTSAWWRSATSGVERAIRQLIIGISDRIGASLALGTDAGCLVLSLGPLYKGSVWSMSTNSVKILRAKSAGFSNLRYSRIESTSADCSARLACDIDAEEERATQQAGIPGEVENLD